MDNVICYLCADPAKPLKEWRTACGLPANEAAAHIAEPSQATCPRCCSVVSHFRSLADQSRNSGIGPAADDSHYGLEALEGIQS